MIIITLRPPGGSDDGSSDIYLTEEDTPPPYSYRVKRWVNTPSLARFYEEQNTAAAVYDRLIRWIDEGMPPERGMPPAVPRGGTLYARRVTIGSALSGYQFTPRSEAVSHQI
jgi:hypothetical protein